MDKLPEMELRPLIFTFYLHLHAVFRLFTYIHIYA
jgi:hypothetical protein